MRRGLLQRHIEESESRIQRGQRNIAIQREAVSELERGNQDATIAKALLTIFDKALAVYVADREQLLKQLADRG
jgi:hypothetical protein